MTIAPTTVFALEERVPYAEIGTGQVDVITDPFRLLCVRDPRKVHDARVLPARTLAECVFGCGYRGGPVRFRS